MTERWEEWHAKFIRDVTPEPPSQSWGLDDIPARALRDACKMLAELERERDEVRGIVDDCVDFLGGLPEGGGGLRQLIGNVMRERDEAQSLCDRHRDAIHDLVEEKAFAVRERDEALAKCAMIEEEVLSRMDRSIADAERRGAEREREAIVGIVKDAATRASRRSREMAGTDHVMRWDRAACELTAVTIEIQRRTQGGGS